MLLTKGAKMLKGIFKGLIAGWVVKKVSKHFRRRQDRAR